MGTRNLLVELFVEELPPKSLKKLGDAFAEAVAAYAKEFAAGVSPRSTRIIKRQVFEALSSDLDHAFATAEKEMHLSLQCEDFKEGIAHFMEKRPPCFTGN